jgi:ribosomal protein S18 acetylase RimI-like enzyme
MDLNIRPARHTDVGSVVSVHLEAFQGFFLSFLGAAFLRELYQAILADPSGMGYVCEQSQQIVGFVFGTDQPAGFYRRLLRQRWWRFGVASVAPVLRRPSVMPRILRAFHMPQQASSEPGVGTLMSIAVSPGIQANGVGQALVHAFLQEAARRNLKKINLTTDRIGNDPANHFYQKQGFILDHCFVTPEGRQMNEYVIELRAVGSKE